MQMANRIYIYIIYIYMHICISLTTFIAKIQYFTKYLNYGFK